MPYRGTSQHKHTSHSISLEPQRQASNLDMPLGVVVMIPECLEKEQGLPKSQPRLIQVVNQQMEHKLRTWMTNLVFVIAEEAVLVELLQKLPASSCQQTRSHSWRKRWWLLQRQQETCLTSYWAIVLTMFCCVRQCQSNVNWLRI